MTGPFSVRKIQEPGGVVRLAILGEIDEDVRELLTTVIDNAAGRDGVTALLVDLSRVPFLAAAGIRALLHGRETAALHGLRYAVVGADGMVAEVMIAAGVSGLLTGHMYGPGRSIGRTARTSGPA